MAHDELNRLNLSNYKIIHIRCGDDELIRNIINDDLHNNVLTKIKDYMDDTILVIGDSNIVKNKIKIKYPHVNIIQNTLSHIGEGVTNSDNSYISLLHCFLIYYLYHYQKK